MRHSFVLSSISLFFFSSLQCFDSNYIKNIYNNPTTEITFPLSFVRNSQKNHEEMILNLSDIHFTYDQTLIRESSVMCRHSQMYFYHTASVSFDSCFWLTEFVSNNIIGRLIALTTHVRMRKNEGENKINKLAPTLINIMCVRCDVAFHTVNGGGEKTTQNCNLLLMQTIYGRRLLSWCWA